VYKLAYNTNVQHARTPRDALSRSHKFDVIATTAVQWRGYQLRQRYYITPSSTGLLHAVMHMYDIVIMHSLKIGFSRITPANLNGSG